MIGSTEGVAAVLLAVAAFWFWLEEKSGWKVFELFPPLLFIYATPVVLNNTGVIPASSEAYDVLRSFGLPLFICLMLLNVDVAAAVRVMGRGVLVMLMGTAGIVIGAPIAYLAVHSWLSPDAWTGYGALAGSWIGGTGNMAAAAEALAASPEQLGLAVLADNVVYIAWIPLLLGSRAVADRFNRWARVPADRIERMDQAALAEEREQQTPAMRHYLYLGGIGLVVTWTASTVAPMLPEIDPILSASTWKILVITTVSLLLSATPLRRIPGSQNLAIALIYVFVAGMGARASISGLTEAPAFVAGAFIWIAIHGLFCIAGAWLFRVDIHTLAIASAANVGGAASAPVVAAYHRESLVPASILMALLGYALGNYLAIVTGHLCRLVV